MDIEIIDQPIRFHLHGLSSAVDNNCYGEVGCRLMDQMWAIVKQAGLKTTGINHWVYFAGHRMFVGVEVSDGQQGATAEQLEPCEFELPRYSKHVHVGPYSDLPQKGKRCRPSSQLVERASPCLRWRSTATSPKATMTLSQKPPF
jgi:hypothetical protein